MQEDLKPLEWLIGQWEGVQGAGVYHESWEKISDTKFNGRAYMIMKGEIKNVEILKLHEDGNEIYYIADASHNPAPVSFKLTDHDETSFTFENPKHDFPQKITYEKKENNSLLATIEGIKNGKLRNAEFNLKKVIDDF